jgi:large subunit ribosomal protein L30
MSPKAIIEEAGDDKATSSRLKITLSKSLLGHPEKHRRIARALGLTRTHRSVVQYDTPIIRGMIMKISHLLTVEAA